MIGAIVLIGGVAAAVIFYVRPKHNAEAENPEQEALEGGDNERYGRQDERHPLL